jgi:uncharacterized protein YjbI with pentapeptide repeats
MMEMAAIPRELSGLDFAAARLDRCMLYAPDFRNARLEGATFYAVDLEGALLALILRARPLETHILMMLAFSTLI